MDTQLARDKFSLARKLHVTGLSIGFEELEAVPERTHDGVIRVLKKIYVHELSLVTLPADPACRIEQIVEALKHPEISVMPDTFTRKAMEDQDRSFKNSLFEVKNGE